VHVVVHVVVQVVVQVVEQVVAVDGRECHVQARNVAFTQGQTHVSDDRGLEHQGWNVQRQATGEE
jgi:hypothetical protein